MKRIIIFLINIWLFGFVVKSQDLYLIKIEPKQDLCFNKLINYQKDTLEIVSCAKYVIFPFGQIDNIKQLTTSLLKDFKIKSQKTNDSINFYYQLENDNNRVTLTIDFDTEASVHSNIVSGLIKTKNVKTINDIFIGMTKESFFKTIFKSFPNDLKYNIVILDYCVSGIRHIYRFKDNILDEIEYQ